MKYPLVEIETFFFTIFWPVEMKTLFLTFIGHLFGIFITNNLKFLYTPFLMLTFLPGCIKYILTTIH